ncbi:hypothetical protein ACH4FE_35855 [Streptomyces celluloflavus]|uniref:hypothetical protein n=1 Tax=Streptomyces celluloflavus TaxID=58344 RepID=UPI0037A74A0D
MVLRSDCQGRHRHQVGVLVQEQVGNLPAQGAQIGDGPVRVVETKRSQTGAPDPARAAPRGPDGDDDGEQLGVGRGQRQGGGVGEK